ncbi:neuronal acetylcholine receptor subunit alpha-10-like [Sabethes cyaneus]|uniref:neuronal acetylcholine receptor subunit alpha-10-like n=1 Tax=Sabethes cyaneus TaxID=53552 RepID=UPI00237DD563|nr:neuronal acetylcholine receptor subunit alpha-10-like [Sabethes cyaneus]
MKLLNRLFIVAISIVTCLVQSSESINCDKDPTHVEGRLKKQLLCGNYNSELRPVKDSKLSVNVSVTPVLMSYDYDDREDTLNANILLILQWTDAFLSWDSKAFSNISSIVVNADEIWTPDLQLFSSYYKPDSKASCTNLRCRVKSNGGALCVPSCDFNGRCDSDYSDWPLDLQQCFLYYGAWMESASEVDFHSDLTWLGSTQSNDHIQWRVISAKTDKQSIKSISDNHSYPVLIYDYIIERHSNFHMATILTPIFLLIILNLFLTWLDTDSIERKLLLGVSIICHFKYLALLQWAAPANGDTVPGLLIFLRNSIIIVCLLLVQTLLGSALKRMKRTPPNTIILLTGNIQKNKVGELILAGNYMSVEYKKSVIPLDTSAETCPNRTVWSTFSKTLDRMFFLLFLGCYAVFFFMYVPLRYNRPSDLELYILDYDDVNHVV